MPAEYRVGYGRPPTHTQFKPGQSGNPTGRPKGHRNFRTDLFDELAIVEVIDGPAGRERIPRQRLIVRRFVERAMNDPKTATLLISLLTRLYPPADEDLDVSDTDKAIVDGFIEEELTKRERKAPKLR